MIFDEFVESSCTTWWLGWLSPRIFSGYYYISYILIKKRRSSNTSFYPAPNFTIIFTEGEKKLFEPWWQPLTVLVSQTVFQISERLCEPVSTTASSKGECEYPPWYLLMFSSLFWFLNKIKEGKDLGLEILSGLSHYCCVKPCFGK